MTSPWRLASRGAVGPEHERDVRVGGLGERRARGRARAGAASSPRGRSRGRPPRCPARRRRPRPRGCRPGAPSLRRTTKSSTTPDTGPSRRSVNATTRRLRPHAQGRRAPGGALLRQLRGAQLQAGPRVGALGQRPVRRARRRADLRAGAEALVQQPAPPQRLQRLRVGVEPRRLEHDLAVPVQPERGQVGELLLGRPRPHAARVEVLHPHQERRAGRAREQPRQQRRAQVARGAACPSGSGRSARAHTVNGSESATSASRGASGRARE